MIKLTKFGKTEVEFYINPHMIEFMEATPDTVIRMMSEKVIVVKESPEEVTKRIIEYRKHIGLIGNDTPL